jgi:hypothetical protein
MRRVRQMISSSEDVIAILMKHGATEAQAKQIMTDVYAVPVEQSDRNRNYHRAKWCIEKAKEYGRQNAETTMGHRE